MDRWYPSFAESAHLNWWCADPRQGGVSCHIDIRPSSAEWSWTCWLLEGRWRLCKLISVCRIRPFTTGASRTLLTGAWSWVSRLREKEELRTARRRVVELETELAVTRRANELLKAQVVSPRDGMKRSRR